jgi:hypothetical protein
MVEVAINKKGQQQPREIKVKQREPALVAAVNVKSKKGIGLCQDS